MKVLSYANRQIFIAKERKNMGLITGKCQNCGGAVEFNDLTKKGFCTHCGTQFVKEDIVQNIIQNIKIENAVIQNGGSAESLLNRAKQSKANGDFCSAVEYASLALEIEPNNEEAQEISEKTFCINGSYLSLKQVTEINTLLKQTSSIYKKKHANKALTRAAKLLMDFLGANVFQYFSLKKIIKEWKLNGVDSIITAKNARKIPIINKYNIAFAIGVALFIVAAITASIG